MVLRGKASQVASGRGGNWTAREEKGGASFGKASRGAWPAALGLLPLPSPPCAAVWLGGGRTGRGPRQGWPTGSCLEKTRKKESQVDVRFPWVWLPAEWLAVLTPRPDQEG